MRRFYRFELFVVLLCSFAITVVVFRQYFFRQKILFPSNLLVSTYSPWKYEPVPEYPNGPPNKPMGFDNIRQSFPDLNFFKDSLEHGMLPLWNPYIYSGTPFMAAFTPAVWYPFSWIAILLPTVEGWNFLVVVQPIASMLFMYLFLRSLKFRISLSAFGAFAYAFSGWMVVYWQEFLVLEHSFLWLPLALYASNRVWERYDDTVGFFLLTLALTCSVLGGFLQMAMYVYIVVLLWNIFCYLQNHRQENRFKPAMRIIGSCIAAFFVASIQLVPTFEAAGLSPRETIDGSFVFRDNLLPLTRLITLLAPDYWGNPSTYNYFGGAGFYFEKMIFVGIIPLLLAVYATVTAKKKNVLFWVIIALVSVSMGFALPTSWLPYYLHIPVLSNSYPTRIFAVSAFSLIVLSCYGLESFMKNPDRTRMMYILASFSLVLVSGWVVVLSAWCIRVNYQTSALLCSPKASILWNVVGDFFHILKDARLYATVSLRNLIVPTIFLVCGWSFLIVSKYFKRYMFIMVCCLTVASGVYFAQKYLYFGERRFVYPSLPVIQKLTSIAGYDRIWGYGNAFIEKNFAEYFHWFSTDGYSTLSPKRYAQLISTINNQGRLGGTIRRSDTDLYEVSEMDPFGSTNPYRLRMMSLLGVKYILEVKKGQFKDTQPTVKRFPPSIFTPVWENATWRIWRYDPVLPRAVFATHVLVRIQPQEIIDALYNPTVNLADTIVLEKQPLPLVAGSGSASSSAQIVSYGANDVVINVNAQTDGYVLLTDNDYPGWTARVDGKPTEVYRADYAFRAVFVPKGASRVVFSYLPDSVIAGGVISGVTVLCFVLFCLRQLRAKQKYKQTVPDTAHEGDNTYNKTNTK